MPAPAGVTKSGHRVNVRRDTLDFRDLMYVPTLVEVPTQIPLEDYRHCNVPRLNQGREGACTGFGLATVVHYLLRRRRVVPDETSVSPSMLYALAKRYDEWPGEEYEGSSARGAMKGWHKHGVCSDALWSTDKRLSPPVMADAVNRPLGAYFRVNHKDLVALHCAISEVGVLYASASVHTGWEEVDSSTGKIPLQEDFLGGHAFAVVAYNEEGFWIQNSWGGGWGKEGFALITYDDWLANATDVWVARLGVPTKGITAEGVADKFQSGTSRTDAFTNFELRPHIISIGNDGKLRNDGIFGTSEGDLADLIKQHIPNVTANWKKKRILLYAHGGLVSENAAIQRVAEYRESLLQSEVYPLAFVWKSDYWTTLTNILKDAFSRRRPEGFLDAAKDFMLDRLDDALEPLARILTGKAAWDEMKENALLATVAAKGGARLLAQHLAALAKSDPAVEVHVIGHSAGAIFHAPLVQLLSTKGKISSGLMKGVKGLGVKVGTCTLWAPACTIDLFEESYLPSIQNNQIGSFALFTLTDEAEADDHCANIYHKSLLYLVSNAFEDKPRIPVFRDGEPILGMKNFVEKNANLKKLFQSKKADWILAPNDAPPGSAAHSTAHHHGDFDDDQPTVKAGLARILGVRKSPTEFSFARSANSRQDRRRFL